MNRHEALICIQQLRDLNDSESGESCNEEENDEDYREIAVASGDDSSNDDESDDSEIEADNQDSIMMSIDRVLEDINSTSKDGLKWKKIDANEETRTRNKVKFLETPGLSSYSRNRINESALSALMIFIDKQIIERIIKATQAEATAKGDSKFTFEFNDFLACMGVLYFKGINFILIFYSNFIDYFF